MKVFLSADMEGTCGIVSWPETERTTPESCDVYRLLRQMADAGCRYGVMEVSSHALALERVWGINFRVGAFTNLTRDHLDFHRTMEDYCDAKAQLFRQCEAAVCNGDDPWTPRLLRECACPVLRYGTGDSSRLRGENLRLTARSVTFDALLDGRRIPVTVPIPGRFTVYNALAALGICHMLGVPPEQGAAALQTASGIKGRMEVVPTPGLPCTVLIDYAHTPDALENVLTAVRGFAEGRVVAVFDTYIAVLDPRTATETARYDFGGATLQSAAPGQRQTALLLNIRGGNSLVTLDNDLTPLAEIPARQAYGIKATDTAVYLLCPNAVECYGFDGVQNWVQDNFSARPIQVLKASELLVFTGSRAEVLTPPDNANNTNDS